MENRILIRKSLVSNNTPLVNSLSAGEIAINIVDGHLFFKKNGDSGEYISKFLDFENQSHVLNNSLSAFTFQYGNNTVTEIFGSVLGGYSNDIAGAASTVVNGEDNDIAGDFSVIGSGLNNKIGIDGDYSFIAAGSGNLINHSNVYTLGSDLSSHANNFTYVNNLSATGKIYANGVEVTGGGGGSGIDTEVRSLTADWDSTYTTVQTNSASWGGGTPDIIDLTFKSAYTTYYHELNYDSVTTDLSSVQIYEDNTKVTHLFEKLLTYTSTALLTGISITDKVNNNTLTKTLSYDGNDNLISTTRIYT